LVGSDYAELIANSVHRPQPKSSATERADQQSAQLQVAGTTRMWGQSISFWAAPAFCHGPLYFEDENLERHGRSFGLLQPAVSAGQFAGRAAILPYLVGAIPPHECNYTLGRERPGSYAPFWLHRPPVSARGAVYQGAAVAGLSFAVP
jgi:hypothetical protein